MTRSESFSFNPARDIPSLSGKVILVTGGTAGLGTETIFQLSKHTPQRILFTGRNAASAEKVIQSAKEANANLDIAFVQCDFNSLKSVHDAGKHVLSTNTRLDILMCNAGIMAVPKALTSDGYEVQFGVNHLAHALLIKTLLPLLLRTSELPSADVRIISSSSLGFAFATSIVFDKLRTEHDMAVLGAFRRYGDSKLANVLYAQQLAVHYPQITSVSIHPGVIRTGLIDTLSTFNKCFCELATVGQKISIQDGAKNQLWAATCKKEKIQNGVFYEPVGKVGRTTSASKDAKLAAKLWEWTEGELKAFES
ncbi:oxidoreductase [Lindgomyces ingoldianus]|uniref:Oxidoreductase n=1 Tax=Lindgomyces ingoldianus TaxID=673940 RepID=A0ACB6QST7_9PLEO|nr:oxidoreductase [Lindgomyces ingoldianus]KAF2469628.1 oxidoreductase [Lindgomyces ingoldianus]